MLVYLILEIIQIIKKIRIRQPFIPQITEILFLFFYMIKPTQCATSNIRFSFGLCDIQQILFLLRYRSPTKMNPTSRPIKKRAFVSKFDQRTDMGRIMHSRHPDLQPFPPARSSALPGCPSASCSSRASGSST